MEGNVISLAQIFGLCDPIRSRHINTAFGIDRQNVAMGKFTDLVTRTPEARENLEAGMVENLDLLVAPVGHASFARIWYRRRWRWELARSPVVIPACTTEETALIATRSGHADGDLELSALSQHSAGEVRDHVPGLL
jgi:hypothetical protein